jgi:hypothetical protein
MSGNPPAEFQFDVAISFLASDAKIAEAIHQRLSPTLKVFFFPRNQEELAGTDGMVSMRETFRANARIIVVLYRRGWGDTPWTRIEQTAIQEACLAHGWGRLFFVVLDRNDRLPPWLPAHHVRFNWEDFGLEQAVGAIKARALENGAEPQLLTAARRAEIFAADARYRVDKAKINSPEGFGAVHVAVSELLSRIDDQCRELSSGGRVEPFRWERKNDACILTSNSVGMIIRWQQPFINVLDKSALLVEEYDGRLLLTSELNLMLLRTAEMLQRDIYVPELSRAREYGWRKEDEDTEFLTSAALAERCVIQFIDLLDRRARGEFVDDDLI